MNHKDLSYVDKLWLNSNQKVIIDWVEYITNREWNNLITIETNNISGEYVKKYIHNIAELLLLHPIFKNLSINNKIERIKIRDKTLQILNHELIWEWKTYIIVDWIVWYLEYYKWTNGEDNLHLNNPLATVITSDVANFKPLNSKLSIDSKFAYCNWRLIINWWIFPDVNKFKALWDTLFWYDDKNLFRSNYHIKWADVINWVSLIWKEEDELIKDSNGIIYHKNNKVDLEN